MITGSSDTNALFYNFAIPGSMVQGVAAQRRNGFLKGPGKKPVWAPWSSTDSLFGNNAIARTLRAVLWVGINDMGVRMNYDEQLAELFEVATNLYKDGARKFVFINVPPTDRSPAGSRPSPGPSNR